MSFGTTIPLMPGANTLTAKATFVNGEERIATLNLSYDPPPSVTLQTPLDFARFGPAAPGPPSSPLNPKKAVKTH